MLNNEKNIGLEIIRWYSCPNSVTHQLCGAREIKQQWEKHSSDQLVSTD